MQVFRGFFWIWTVAELLVFFAMVHGIGLLGAVGLVILSFIVGLIIVRLQGLVFLQKAQESLKRGGALAADVQAHVSILLGGLFLMIPGFLSSILGLILIIPYLRSWPIRWLVAHGALNWYMRDRGRAAQTSESRGRVIEGEVLSETEGDDKKTQK